MDSKLKRVAILITVLGALMILSIVLVSNATTIKNKFKESSSDDSFGRFYGDSVSGTVSMEKDDVNVSATANTSSPVNIGDDLSGWRHDETFFDNEADSLAAKIYDEMRTLSVKVVSVEKDLRIQVLDYDNNLKEGVEFEILVRDKDNKETTVTDEDKDGIVYLQDIKPGDYDVALLPLEEYIVPDNAIRVSVKDSVEYLMIEDISLLLVNESEANKRSEDTMIVSASDDADKRLTTKFGQDENRVYGIDVSSDNGEINWGEVYKSGIRFVMLRAGYRGASNGELIVDERFSEYAKEASKAGLDVGAYFYTQALNEIEAVEEASALLMITSGAQITMPLAIRFDVAGGMGRADGLDTDTRTTIAEVFCQTIKNMGKEPCVYATKNWLNTNLNAKLIEKYKVWMAEFRATPTYEGYYDIWQYTCKGKVPGIDGEVNLSVSYLGE